MQHPPWRWGPGQRHRPSEIFCALTLVLQVFSLAKGLPAVIMMMTKYSFNLDWERLARILNHAAEDQDRLPTNLIYGLWKRCMGSLERDSDTLRDYNVCLSQHFPLWIYGFVAFWHWHCQFWIVTISSSEGESIFSLIWEPDGAAGGHLAFSLFCHLSFSQSALQ
jgi:hypothetical protein